MLAKNYLNICVIYNTQCIVIFVVIVAKEDKKFKNIYHYEFEFFVDKIERRIEKRNKFNEKKNSVLRKKTRQNDRKKKRKTIQRKSERERERKKDTQRKRKKEDK